MPQTKAPTPGADERWPRASGEAMRERLQEWVNTKYDSNWSRCAKATGLDPKLFDRWKRGGDLGFKTLGALSACGLSLTWLFTGTGEMAWVSAMPGSTDDASLRKLVMLLQSATGAGDNTAHQAFTRLLVDLDPNARIARATQVILPQFKAAVDDIRSNDMRLQWTSMIIGHLIAIDDAAKANNAENMRAAIRELSPHVDACLRLYAEMMESQRPVWLAEIEREQNLVREAAKQGFHEQALDIANRVEVLLGGIAKALDRIAEHATSDCPELNLRLGDIHEALKSIERQTAVLRTASSRPDA
jgi:hypothetical protein